MALIDVEIAFIHSDHFHVTTGLQGKNLAKQNSGRLDTREHKEMMLQWDDVKQMLLVTWGGRTGYIPSAAVKSFFPFQEAGKVTPLPKNETAMPNPKVKAQVDSPQSHVHAGLGYGKTGK